MRYRIHSFPTRVIYFQFCDVPISPRSVYYDSYSENFVDKNFCDTSMYNDYIQLIGQNCNLIVILIVVLFNMVFTIKYGYVLRAVKVVSTKQG